MESKYEKGNAYFFIFKQLDNYFDKNVHQNKEVIIYDIIWSISFSVFMFF